MDPSYEFEWHCDWWLVKCGASVPSPHFGPTGSGWVKPEMLKPWGHASRPKFWPRLRNLWPRPQNFGLGLKMQFHLSTEFSVPSFWDYSVFKEQAFFCCTHTLTIIMPSTSIGTGGALWNVRPSVCVSVCRVPRSNSRTKRSRKPKIGRMEARVTHEPI